MKTFPIRNGERYSTIPVCHDAVKIARDKPMDVDEMRRRVRVLKFLDQAKADGADHIDLEDADWLLLKNEMNSPRWGLAEEALLQIIDDVLEAKTVPRQKPQEVPKGSPAKVCVSHTE